MLFYRGSTSRFLNRAGAIEHLRTIAHQAAAEFPQIEQIILFGSLARGEAVSNSDADLFVALKESEHSRRENRIPQLLELFRDSNLPVDIIPWTANEIAEGLNNDHRWLKRIFSEGIELYKR